METNISRTLGNLITFFLFTTTLICASDENSFYPTDNSTNTVINKSYQTMTTSQLEKEVEKRSINGNLSFPMGVELIKRWTNR